MLETREATLITAQKEIIVAEMQQQDVWTKRARPSIVYAGLLFIFLVHVAFPMITFWGTLKVPELILPEAFWWSWTGVCGAWVVGRSFEKNGTQGKIVDLLTK